MTRWAMIADLNRCVGCQTCTAACKHTNATAPGIQWRRVLDIEAGDYPEVRRAFVPVGCMHCEDPPCVAVCPSTATRKRDDGMVTIDYDLCIGCAYCAVACPYQARFKLERPATAYGGRRMAHEAAREMPERLGVAQKCTFCIDRVDPGRAAGLVPGEDAGTGPACAEACIADALHFGDLDDPDSRVARMLAENESFVMHEELGTGPAFHYIWGPKGAERTDPPAHARAEPSDVGHLGVAPWRQRSWDARAAANFICGGAGSGLVLVAGLAGLASGGVPEGAFVAGLALVALGLACVWAEIGRPWRFLNVFRHPATSWMSREALVALALFPAGLGAILLPGSPGQALGLVAALLAAGFLWCQARILRAAAGIPLWRAPEVVALIVTTGLAEGAGLWLGFALAGAGAVPVAGGLLAVLVGARWLAWRRYRAGFAARGAPTRALAALDAVTRAFVLGGHLLPLGLVALAAALPAAVPVAPALAGAAALAAGWLLKFVLITRAAYNQGFAIPRMPRRGAGASAPGIRPGWVAAAGDGG